MGISFNSAYHPQNRSRSNNYNELNWFHYWVNVGTTIWLVALSEIVNQFHTNYWCDYYGSRCHDN